MADTALEQLELRRLQRVDRPLEPPQSHQQQQPQPLRQAPVTQQAPMAPPQGGSMEMLKQRRAERRAQTPTRSGGFTLGHAGDLFTHGATLGYAGQLEGFEKAAIDYMFDTHPDKDWDEVFAEAEADWQSDINEARQAAGWLGAGLTEGLGTAATLVATGGALGATGQGTTQIGQALGNKALTNAGKILKGTVTYGKSFWTKLAQNTALGAGLGASFAHGEGGDIKQSAAIGAIMGPLGAAAGVAIGGAIARAATSVSRVFSSKGQFTKEFKDKIIESGLDPDDITPEQAADLLRKMDSAEDVQAAIQSFGADFQKRLADDLTAQDAMRAARIQRGQAPSKRTEAEQRFGFSYLDAERRGDANAMQQNEMIQRGAYGPQSAEAMNAAKTQQARQVESARDRFGQEMTGLPGDELGPEVDLTQFTQNVSRRANQEMQGLQSRSQQAMDWGRRVETDEAGWDDIVGAARERAARDQILVEPRVQTALRQFEKVKDYSKEAGQLPNFAQYNAVRSKTLSAARRSTDSQIRQELNAVVGIMDDEIDRAVTRGLMRGDALDVTKVKDYRAAWKSWFDRYGPGDARMPAPQRAAQNFINMMVDHQATARQTVRTLFGTKVAGQSDVSVEMIKWAVERGGLPPEDLQLLRRAAFDFVTRGGLSQTAGEAQAKVLTPGIGDMIPRKVGRALKDFATRPAKGQDMAKLLFNEQELADMAKLGDALIRIPGPRDFNASGTASSLAQLLYDFAAARSFGAVGASAGAVVGGPGGAAVGGFAGEQLGRQAAGASRDAAKLRAVRQELGITEGSGSPFADELDAVMRWGGGVTGAAVGAQSGAQFERDVRQQRNN